MFLIELFLFLVLVVAMMFFRLKPLFWTGGVGAILLVSSLLQSLSPYILIPAWLIYIAAAIFVNVGSLRRRFVTRHIVKIFRKVLPPMSETERAALEAGAVYWEGELFQGRPNWKKLHEYPKPTLTLEEQSFLENQVKTLCTMLDDWQLVQEGDLGEAVWDYMKKEKFFGMLIPKAYGGLQFSAFMQSTVVSMLATRSVSAGVTVMVPNSLGPAELLLHYGTEEQKNYYLPRLADGREVPCFALTSTQGGSDAGAMPDAGVVCHGIHEGKSVLGIRLNFNKRYITLAPKSTLVGLAFKLYDPEHLIGKVEDIGITCALLPHDHPGMDVGKRHWPVYLAFQNGPVRGKDVFIPMEWVIGGQSQVGNGWRMLMECLSAGRGISLPALSAGGCKMYYATTGAYAKLREQFGISIGHFEGIHEELAKMAGLTYMIEACRCFTAGAVDQVGKPSLASAIAKYHMTEVLRTVTNAAFDIHAGRAIQTGPRNYLANIYMSVPVAITVEGANILTRNLIIFGQGAVRCHPYIFEEMQALMDEDQERGIKRFDKLLVSHMGYGLCNFVRAVCYGLTGGALIVSPRQGEIAYYYKQLTRMSTAVSLISGLSMMILGGDLKRKESISARLGDILSYLYMGSAVLKYYEDHEKTEVDLLHVRWVLQYALHQIQEAFYSVFANFPNKLKGHLFRVIIFPWGRSYKEPSYYLGRKLADLMMTDNPLRQRFHQQIWHSTDPKDCMGRVESAFLSMLEVEPLLRKLHQAIKAGRVRKQGSWEDKLTHALSAGVLTQEEGEALRTFEKKRLDALEVDDFSADLSEVLS